MNKRHRTWKRAALLAVVMGAMVMASSEGQAQETEPRTLKVALAQTLCIPGDRAGNGVRIEHAIAEAKRHGAELVCFPEMALLGWTYAPAHQRAHPIPGHDSKYLCKLARQHQIYLCIGLAEKSDDDLFDACILIDDTGQLLLTHRKRNILTELMDPPYTSGESVRVVTTPWGRVGMLICADTFDPKTVAAMTEQRPDLLLVPYGWAQREDAWPQHSKSLHDLVIRTARKMNCPVVGTNVVGGISSGPWAGMVFGGQSIAVDAGGDVLGIGRDRDTDLIVVEIPLPNAAQPSPATGGGN